MDEYKTTLMKRTADWQSTTKKNGDLEAEIARLTLLLDEANTRIKFLEGELNISDKLMNDSTKEGWLQKLSPNQALGKKLQKRFFVLKYE